MTEPAKNENQEIAILQIGYGYWGPNLTRNLALLPNVHIAALSEVQQKNIERFKTNFPDVPVYTDYTECLERKDINAVVVSTPAALHYEMTRDALEQGKHVLVEKPLALSSNEGNDLIERARKNNCILMVGHTFLYNAAVRTVKDYIDSGTLGDVYYIYSHRLNLGRIRQDINSLWNFAPHDISIILYLMEKELPLNITARGFSYIQKNIEDVVFLTLEFPDSVCAHIHVSWIDPNKVRKMTIVGSKRMVVYDDVSNEAKIQLYDKGVDKQFNDTALEDFENYGEFQLLLRGGDVVVPRIDFVEPLKVECKHFVECIRSGIQPITNGTHGVQVVKILEAAELSMRNQGKEMPIEW